jgi:predicted tellurium resistance membrane protein TerC
VVLRLSFICAGLAVVEQFKGVLLVFAGILLYSAYGLLTDEDDEPEDLSQNPVVKLTKQYLPSTDTYDGDRFFTTGADGVASVATPLLLALVCVEISDVIFAVDSIPAVFGVTTDPFIAFTSNAFALLGLRALYTIISQAADDYKCARARALHLPPPRRRPPPRTGRTPSLPRPRPCPRMHPTDRHPTDRQPLPARPPNLHSRPALSADAPVPSLPLRRSAAPLLLRYLQPAIAVVLGFIGVKLIGEFGGIEVPTVSSLLFVLGVLGTGVAASVLEATAEDDADGGAEGSAAGEPDGKA